jgi:FkbH-like protein
MVTGNAVGPGVDVGKEWRDLWREWRVATDYADIVRLCRRAERLDAADNPRLLPVRVAILSGATIDFLLPVLRTALFSVGLRPTFHVTPFNQFVPTLLDPGRSLVSFEAQVTIIVNTVHHIPQWPAPGDSLEQVTAAVDDACRFFLDPCATFHERTGSEIILCNFHPLPGRAAGNLGAKSRSDRTNFIRRLNVVLGDRSPRYVHLADVASLAERHGLERWFDSRYWFLAKQPVSFECVPDYCRNLAGIVGAIFGRSKKCLVVDLDNTLWGGVIGDDGLAGIQIGEGNAAGEAFKAFQLFIRELKERGVLLAVCSKNDERIAQSAFTDHPEMVLGLGDFVAFKANWLPKSQNIQAIAAELDLPLDALVFVDDNPAERDEVACALPDVAVPDLPGDAADFPRTIDAGRYFESVSLTREDLDRTVAYQSRRAARAQLAEAPDIRGYLASLEMKASIRPFEKVSFERITQLTNKTNQFNLTTRRLRHAEIEHMASDNRWLTRSVRLKDRWGDQGLISVLFGPVDHLELTLEGWLMSCRVLNRGVEQFVFNHLIAAARERGICEIVGYYKPTDRNGIVKDHYRNLGFTLMSEIDGVARWRLMVAEALPLETFVECDEQTVAE